MCNWYAINPRYGAGRIQINAEVIKDACEVISHKAQSKQVITYSEIMDQLKKAGHGKINRGTIGHIVGEVSNQVAKTTAPSTYPSAIVIRKDTGQPGRGFWGLDTGTDPPLKVPHKQKAYRLQKYQDDVFSKHWSCAC